MNRNSHFRAARLACVLLLAGALAACSEAPTGTMPGARPAHPLLTTYPAPTLSVSNSGGYPLISWTALAGASSYSVALIENRTTIDKATFNSTTQVFTYPLGSTTGTSFLDSSHAYTGSSFCSSYGTYTTVMTRYTYRVTATFVDGSSTASISAPLAPC
jgi:hypothetical protein